MRWSQADKEPDFEKSLPLYDQAIEKYRKSLVALPAGQRRDDREADMEPRLYKHERMVKKYWADGQALEKEGKIVEALSAYDKAIASFHPTVPQNDRMWSRLHAQDLRNRITGAKTWSADGEAKQKAGKIAEAIASYEQSLKLLPDAALEEHVRMLEGRQAEAGEKEGRGGQALAGGDGALQPGATERCTVEVQREPRLLVRWHTDEVRGGHRGETGEGRVAQGRRGETAEGRTAFPKPSPSIRRA